MSSLFCWAEHFAISRRNMPVHVCVSADTEATKRKRVWLWLLAIHGKTQQFFACAKICNFLTVVFQIFFFFFKNKCTISGRNHFHNDRLVLVKQEGIVQECKMCLTLFRFG